MLVLLVMLGIAHAAVPGEILATPGPSDLRSLWKESARLENVQGPAAELACRPLAEDLPLCFRVEEGQRRRWVTQADLLVWGVTLAELESLGSAVLVSNPLEIRNVQDGPWHWWRVNTPAGREGTIFLHPEWLAIAGPNAALAMPGRDALFAWNLGDPDLDKIMAVGIRKAYESSEFPVTTKVLGFDGSKWVVRGESSSTDPAVPQ